MTQKTLKPGIHALVSLDNATLAPRDLACLGLTSNLSFPHVYAPGVAVAAVDPDANALEVHESPEAITAFAGYLDEPQELAATLGLPGETSAAVLAATSLQRFAAEAPLRMLGEWSLLHFDRLARKLTLLTSLAYRDRIHYAVLGKFVAVSPDMLALTSLPGLGRAIDPEGFALAVSRPALRARRGSRTVWRGVLRVPPGTREVFSLAQRTSTPPAPEALPALFRGTFDEAVEASTAAVRTILRQQLVRAGRSAFLLSGGLDSALLAAFAAQVRGPGAAMFAITSVAPTGTHLPDERESSAAVAAFLSIEQRTVTPPPEASVYIPSALTVQATQNPMMGMRHYLYETLYECAVQGGAKALVDGLNGEMSISWNPAPAIEGWWLQRWYRHTLSWKARRSGQNMYSGEAFAVRLAPSLLQTMPAAWVDIIRRGPDLPALPNPGMPLGFSPTIAKMAIMDTETTAGIRHLYPYRDMRLLRLAASFPGTFFTRPGLTRPIARSMLRGQIPESVRLNTKPRPFSPDYELRLATQAAAALERTQIYRAAGIAHWLDLDWLDQSLRRTRDHGSHQAQFQAQLTCGAAEFLLAFNPLENRPPAAS